MQLLTKHQCAKLLHACTKTVMLCAPTVCDIDVPHHGGVAFLPGVVVSEIVTGHYPTQCEPHPCLKWLQENHTSQTPLHPKYLIGCPEWMHPLQMEAVAKSSKPANNSLPST